MLLNNQPCDVPIKGITRINKWDIRTIRLGQCVLSGWINAFCRITFFWVANRKNARKRKGNHKSGAKLTLMRSHLSMSGHKLYCTQTLLHRLKDAPFATDTDKHTNIPTLSIALTASTVHRYPSLICTFHVRWPIVWKSHIFR